MKSVIQMSVAAIALGLLLGGCSSSNKSSASTSESIMSTAQKIDSGGSKIDATVASLNSLTSAAPGTDLRPLFKKYKETVEDLESTAKDVKARADGMKAKGQAYFAEWDKQVATMNNEDIKARSAERRAAVETSFANIKNHYQELTTAYHPMMSDLKDIQTALQTDLTSGGIKAIKPIADRIAGEATKVKEAAGKLSQEFKALGVQMSPKGK